MKEMGKENIRKNHIKFAYLIKWLDSLASLVESPAVATGIATRRRTEKKENGFKRDLGVATIVIMENYGKP